jgi:ABC-2 type transport system ATP-binding protein
MSEMATQPIAFFDATKRYGDTTALDTLSLQIQAGGLTSILGPNGAGKTTLIAMVLGQTAPTRGQVRVFGAAPGERAVRLRMGAMLQSAGVTPQLTVRETIEVFSSYYAAPYSVDDTLALAALESLADRRYAKLSGGQQRRVQFAVAICGRPELLLLDEPTVALDAEARRGVWDVVRDLVRRGSTIVLTTHQLEEAEALSQRVLVLASGRIVADGTPSEVKSKVAARRIQCITRLTSDQLRDMPGVHTVRRAGQHTEIVCNEAEQIVRELLTRDATLADLSITGSTLEDAVLELTRRTQSSTVRSAQ